MLVVFASHKDRAVAGAELHTDFRLSAEGETVFLVFSNGTTIVSTLEVPRGYTDVSFGRDPTGVETYFVAPTPGLGHQGAQPLAIHRRVLIQESAEGGVTRYLPSDEMMSIYEAATRYAEDKTPLVVLAPTHKVTGEFKTLFNELNGKSL